jgi:DNA processing protein
MLMTPARRNSTMSRTSPRSGRYVPPPSPGVTWLRDALAAAGRGHLSARQLDIFRRGDPAQVDDLKLFYAGDLSILTRRCVSVVGTREATHEGAARAARLARELVAAEVAVVSGLARGIDAAAHRSAMEAGGRAVAVIGTPLSKASPAQNAEMQETIWRKHLLISPFAEGTPVFKSNFPQRNRVMAAISDATVIVQASDTSGTLHQAAECQHLGRWLFIAKSVVDDPNLSWPKKFLGKPKTEILSSTEQVVRAISEG